MKLCPPVELVINTTWLHQANFTDEETTFTVIAYEMKNDPKTPSAEMTFCLLVALYAYGE